MGETAKILFANEAFYTAFATADCQAMEDIWARGHPVSVVHPGGAAIFGRDEVLASWAGILGETDSFDIECRAPVVQVFGQAALVLCYERVGNHKLIATNTFVTERDRWRLVHHQSAPSPILPDATSGPIRPLH